MRAIFRRAIISMASTPNRRPNPTRPGLRLRDVAAQLRLYKPKSTTAGDDSGDDVDDRGKVFSQLALPESAAAAAAAPSIQPKFRPQRAAVLVCLFEGESGDLRVILTKRSSNLSTHSGEVALPGGKAEEGDAGDAETATREAKEEIGLDPEIVNVVTVLEPFLSKHLLRVVPVIGILTNKDAFKPVVNTAEVEAVFDAPLEMFLKNENRRSEEGEWMGVKFVVHYFDLETATGKFVIWGLTAAILIRAASVVYRRPPSFLEQERNFVLPETLSRQ